MKHKHVHRFFNGKQRFDFMTSSGPKVEIIQQIFFPNIPARHLMIQVVFVVVAVCCLSYVVCWLLLFFFNCPTGCGIRSMNRSYQWCVFRSGSCLTCLWTTRSNHKRDGKKNTGHDEFQGIFQLPVFFFSDVNFCHPTPVFLGGGQIHNKRLCFFLKNQRFAKDGMFFTHRDGTLPGGQPLN